MLRRTLLVALLALAPVAARACNPVSADFAGTVQVYEGTVGSYSVRVGLQFAPGGEVAGRYGYANSQGTITLVGRLADGALGLTEHGGRNGAVSGHFALNTRETNGNCNFAGDWHAPRSEKKLPVLLAFSDSSMRKLSYYTSTTALRIERAAVALRAAIIAGRRTEVAAAIRYPIFAELAGKRTKITSTASLLAHYNAIFTPAFVARIRSEIPHMMFVRDQGTMLGNGELWFDDSGQAIAINN